MKLQDMDNNVDLKAAAQGAQFQSDAFEFAPQWASAIEGLGGTEASPDPSYVFRTVPVSALPGKLSFLLQFHSLKATKGILFIQALAVSAFPGSMPIPVLTVTVPLVDVIAAGGEYQVEVTSRRNMLYAVTGNIYDETDSAAEGLSVRVQLPGEVEGTKPSWSARLGIAKRVEAVSPNVAEMETVMRLLSLDAPNFLQPVSQGWTRGQCAEPIFAEWLAAAGRNAEPTRANWEYGFILQVLSRYGALRRGALGLGFNAMAAQTLPALLASHGCSVLAAARHDEPLPDGDPGLALEQLLQPAICSPSEFYERVHFTAINSASLPVEMTDFDFAWSMRMGDHMESAAQFRGFVENAMLCVKPGGLTVHIFRQSHDTGPLASGGVALGRPDIERLALSLIALGHEVAQLKFGYRENASLNGHAEIPFGLVARRSAI